MRTPREPAGLVESVRRGVEDRLWPAEPPATRLGGAALLAGRHAYALLRDLADGELSLRAMSLVFTTVLAIVPLLAFSFSVLKGLDVHRQLEPILRGMLAPIGPEADRVAADIVRFVDNVSGSALATISIAVLLVTVLSMAQKVETSLNFVWRVDRPRSLARRFSEYLSVMLIGPLIMSAAMGLIAAVSSTAIMTRLREAEPIGQWIAAAGGLLPYVMIVAAFTFLYVFVPNTKVRFVPALSGGLLAGTAWAVGGALFTSFVAGASRWVVIYSGFAIVIVTMIWIHLSWLILLLGARFAFYLQNPQELRGAPRVEPLAGAVREQLALAVMLLVGRGFTESSHGGRDESLAAAIGVPARSLASVTAALVGAGLLTRTEDRRLMPARDPRRIGLDDVLAAVRGAPAAGLSGEPWGLLAGEIADAVEQAVRGAAANRTLADLVDDEARMRAEAGAQPRELRATGSRPRP